VPDTIVEAPSVFADLFEDSVQESTSLVASPTAEAITCEPPPGTANKVEELRTLEDGILERSMRVVEASVRFYEIAPGQKEVPPEWVEELGEKAATERLRIMQASWMSAKDAPVGLGNARSTMLGIQKVREASKVPSPTLNVQLVAHFAAPQYEVLQVDSGD
jgi:hypothetical protein